MILILDNYDGCANNIYQLAGEFDPDIRIVRNDRIGPEEILTLKPDHIILSGGSAAPEEAGRDLEIVQTCAGKIPLLGVCLGYRVICASYGASCVQMREIRQGKRLPVELATDSPLFWGLPKTISAGFYHSVTVPEESIPAELRIIARCLGEPAAVSREEERLYGVQFHPESFLSQGGREIMNNFLTRC